MTILIAEDEAKISRIINLQLRHAGYHTAIAKDGVEALKISREQHIDLILMDIMMPNMDGIESCKIIKQENPHIKIIMLTAKDDITDVVEGLDSGADDYVSKPFIFDELLARIRANLRSSHVKNKEKKKEMSPSDSPSSLKPSSTEQAQRFQSQEKDMENTSISSFEDLVMDTKTFEVSRAEQPIDLSKTEFDLLKYLVDHAGTVLSRDEILEHVWGSDFFGSPNVVDVYIKYLRDKIDRKYQRKLINTVRGRGYIVK